MNLCGPTKIMHHFEEDEQEPVAVVRTLSDFALALTLVVLMLIGTRAVNGTKATADTHAATQQAGSSSPDLTVLLADDGNLTVRSGSASTRETSAPVLAQEWIKAHPGNAATVVIEFPPKTLATDLHRALLDLQAAFGTNLSRIETVPHP